MKHLDHESHSTKKENARLHQLVKVRLTDMGEHYLAVNYAERSGISEEEAQHAVKLLFERGEMHVMQLYQLQSYIGDPSEAMGTLIVPSSLSVLSHRDVMALASS